jgi:hypothetical protein
VDLVIDELLIALEVGLVDIEPARHAEEALESRHVHYAHNPNLRAASLDAHCTFV